MMTNAIVATPFLPRTKECSLLMSKIKVGLVVMTKVGLVTGTILLPLNSK